MAKLVSKTYGEALYEVAKEAGKTLEILEEIGCVGEILASNPKFDELMGHPGIPKQEKLQVVESVFKGRVSEELTGLFEIVVSKERYKELPGIFAYYTERVKEEQQIGVAYVTTAVALDAGQKKAVEEKLLQTSGYARMELHYALDASLIGGMVIRIGDRVVDSSVRTKLEGLKRQLLQIQLG